MAGFFISLPAWPFYVALVVAVLAVVAVHAFATSKVLPDDGDRRGN
jgi:Tfp pilus assembly protein PilO